MNNKVSSEKEVKAQPASDFTPKTASFDTAVKLFDEMARQKTLLELNAYCVLMVRPFVVEAPAWREWLLDRYYSVKYVIELPIYKPEDVLNKAGLKALERGEIML